MRPARGQAGGRTGRDFQKIPYYERFCKLERGVLYRNPSLLAACLGMALSTALGGCAVGAQGEKAPLPSVVREAPSRPPVPEPVPILPSTISEATIEQRPFHLKELRVEEAQGQSIVHLQFSEPVVQYRHFVLVQPARIMLDVFGPAKPLPEVENFRAETHWLSVLRLSSGDGHLRLALEIAAANVPAYKIEPEDGGLRMIIGPVNPQFTTKKSLPLVRDGKRVDLPIAEARPAATDPRGQAPADPQAAASKLTGDERTYTGQRISLDFKDADIKNIFRLLAEVSGLNIVVTDDVRQRVTIRLVDVPWDQALDLIIDTNGLAKEQVGNVLRISTSARLKKDRDELLAARRAAESAEIPQTVYLNVNYAKARELVEKIKPVVPASALIVPDDRSNTIIVRGGRKALEEVSEIVGRLDTRTPQVLIESNLIETTPTFARALGLEMDALFNSGRILSSSRFMADPPFSGAPQGILDQLIVPNAGFRFGYFGNNVRSILSAAEQEGQIKIISRPSVVTLNNIESTIASLRILRVALPTSTNIASGTGAAAGAAVATEQIRVGITLSVSPQVSSDGFILLNIKVKSSSLGTQSPGSVVPDELSREAISYVLVRDGETVVIGGIMKDTSQESEAGVPYLKNIPVLGWLFKRIRQQKDFEELMVFITPRLVSAGSENLPMAEELWRDQMRKTEGG